MATMFQVAGVNAIYVQEGQGPENSCATGDVLIYVSPTGNDSKDGSSPSKAVKTIKKAMSLMPPTWRKNMQIIFASGNYDVPSSDTGSFITCGRPLGTQGYPAVFIGGFTNEFGNKSSTATNGGSVHNATATAPVDAYRGAYISMMTGANAGQRRMIANNDAAGNYFTNTPFFTAVANGDQFRIEKPNVHWNVPAGETSGIIQTFGVIGMKGIDVSLPGGATFGIGPDVILDCEGVSFTGDGSFSNVAINHNAALFGDSIDFWWGGSANTLNPFSPLRMGAGISASNFVVVSTTSGGTLASYTCFTDSFVFNSTLSNISPLLSPQFKNAIINGSVDLNISVYGNEANDSGALSKAVFDGTSFGFPAIAVLENSNLDSFGLVIKNSSGDGIQVNRSYASIQDVAGSGNTGVGVSVMGASRAYFGDGSGANDVTVNGALGQVQLGLANPQALWSVMPFGGTSLIAPLSNAAVVMSVASTEGFPTVGLLEIAAEEITYTGKTATTFTGLGRGANGSVAVAHAVGDPVTVGPALSALLTNVAVVATVYSTEGFPTSGTLLIESEEITYTGTTPTTFTGLVRGANSTLAVAHAAGTLVTGPGFITDRRLNLVTNKVG